MPMEQLKQSQEILNLGKKIANEFSKNGRSDTATNWMAHYLAELISNCERETDIKKKELLEKETVDVILKIWSKRQHWEERTRPLSNLKDTIAILNNFKEKNGYNWSSRFDDNDQNEWSRFVKTIKESAETIFTTSICSTLSEENIGKEKEWFNLTSKQLASDEKEVLEELELFINGNTKKIPTKKVGISKVNPEKIAIEKIAELINAQQEALEKLKKGLGIKVKRK
jgi:hypothetical protein